jgi:hypothetical protein
MPRKESDRATNVCTITTMYGGRLDGVAASVRF